MHTRCCQTVLVFSSLEANSAEMAVPTAATTPSQQDVLESAGSLVDEHMQSDAAQMELSAQLKIATHSKLIVHITSS